jgi:hypothetical protein
MLIEIDSLSRPPHRVLAMINLYILNIIKHFYIKVSFMASKVGILRGAAVTPVSEMSLLGV